MLENRILTVSQINSYIKLLLDGDKNLKNILVSGEISDFRLNYLSGHIYFSLKDEGNTVKAVMFNSGLKRLRFNPEDGMKVIVRGTVSAYEVSGQYQIYVGDMQPIGEGFSHLQVEKIKKKLEKEGLFDKERKRAIPKYPKVIGVITSLSGAVLHDIKCVIKRRYPICRLEISPVSVQGEKSEQEIIDAINEFNSQKYKPDVVILARGGGAAEDLSVFNKESLARAVANLSIPVISAIGHETDWTICDCVADMRAPTPSAAAELAAPDKKEIFSILSIFEGKINLLFNETLNEKKNELEYLSGKIKANSPQEKIHFYRERINITQIKLKYELKKIFNVITINLKKLESQLESVNPLNSFFKGYVFLCNEEKRPFKISDAREGQILKLQCIDGYIDVAVKKIGSVKSGE